MPFMRKMNLIYVHFWTYLVYQENTSDEWDIPWYTTRKCCITTLCHAIENTITSLRNEMKNLALKCLKKHRDLKETKETGNGAAY